MNHLDYYFAKLAAAFVRGKVSFKDINQYLPINLLEPPLEILTDSEVCEIIDFGLAIGLRLHKFKRTMGLARVQKVLGILQNLTPNTLLDIGSGRGTFLWPLLDVFPTTSITAIDKEEKRVKDLQAVHNGGITSLSTQLADATELDFEDDSFDIVTMLEVLEHIPQAQQALSEVTRVAKKFVILSVPTKEDDNPEHIHLFDQEKLKNMFQLAGISQVKFDYVLNHVTVVAKVGN